MIPEYQKQTPTYLKGFEMGRADAAAGHAFSRYVLQHAALCRVDWQGCVTGVVGLGTLEDLHGRAYVAGCCAK
jgi:hypothetical protein